jgi:hypothetical protein
MPRLGVGGENQKGLSLKNGGIVSNFVTKKSYKNRSKANVRSESGRTAGRHKGEQENLGMKLITPCCCSLGSSIGGSFKTWRRWRRRRFFFENAPCLQFFTVDFARFWAAGLDSYQAE